MRESIYTIPIHDVFGPETGCPICRLREILEKRCVEFITGPAMMEPDVRIATNREGFCASHLELLTHQKNRLSVALMLETHLDELLNHCLPPKEKKGEQTPDRSCFVCREIDEAIDRMLSTVFRQWQGDPAFREQVRTREYYCLRDYMLLCRRSSAELNRKQRPLFIEDITLPTRRYMERLREDVHAFSLLFDYRNAHKPAGEEAVSGAIERCRAFLK